VITKYDIASNVAQFVEEGFVGVMDARTQRRIFGRNIFGRKTIHIDANNQGRVYGSFKVCFGTDSVSFDFSFQEIADYANNPDNVVVF
jgi:hypothetical protein